MPGQDRCATAAASVPLGRAGAGISRRPAAAGGCGGHAIAPADVAGDTCPDPAAAGAPFGALGSAAAATG